MIPTLILTLAGALSSPTARADFVATYGGFQIGFGIFLLACATKGWLAPGLWAALAALAGFATLRLVAILLYRGRVWSSVWFALGLELFGLGLCACGLARLAPW